MGFLPCCDVVMVDDDFHGANKVDPLLIFVQLFEGYNAILICPFERGREVESTAACDHPNRLGSINYSVARKIFWIDRHS
ncbi:MAG: hypothetical protein E6Q97_18715 [Desulfurellales bacterium]|nr:MAG: hypothetical protein E6Q97_18715 [Desulfurellales bacterium]